MERHQELSHHGHEGDLLRSTALGEPLLEGPEGRASPDRRQGGHVQHAPYRCTSTRDGSSVSHQAGVSVDRGGADESHELVTADGTGFG